MNPQELQQSVEEELLAVYESMYRLAYSYVKNEADAMDIVQESAYKAIKNASAVKNKAFIRTWLWRIVVNTSLDFIRKNSHEIAVEEIYEQGREDIYHDFDTLKALDVLDEREKSVIILRFFEDRKLKDVAEILNENISTIKSVLYRSLRKLKIELSEGDVFYEGTQIR